MSRESAVRLILIEYLELHNSMCMDLPELEEKIIEYQTAYQNGEVKQKTYTDKDKMIALISDNIKKLDVEELKILHSIILEVDKKTLKSLDIIIKNMKNMQ